MQTRRGREKEEAKGRQLRTERAWDLFDAQTRAEADRRTKRQLFEQLGARQMLRLAKDLGIKTQNFEERGTSLRKLLEQELGI